MPPTPGTTRRPRPWYRPALGLVLLQTALAVMVWNRAPGEGLAAYAQVCLGVFLLGLALLAYARTAPKNGRALALTTLLLTQLGAALTALWGVDFAARQARVTLAATLLGGAAAWAYLRWLAPALARRPRWQKLDRWACPALCLGIFGLLLVLGRSVGGTRAWLGTDSLSVQPTEALKPLALLFFAGVFPLEGERPRRRFVLAAGYLGLNAAILLALNEWGTLVLLGLLFLFYTGYYLPRPYLWGSLLAFLALALLTLGAVALILRWQAGAVGFGETLVAVAQKIQARLAVFLDPETDPLGAGYQAAKARQALALGGLLGSSQGVSVPVGQSDYAFVVLVQSFGGLLGLGVLVLFFCQFAAGMSLARAQNEPGACLSRGCAFLIFAQALLMIFGTLGLVPVTGVPVPFLSAGGSYTLVLSWMLGCQLLAAPPEGKTPRPSARLVRKEVGSCTPNEAPNA